MSSDQKTKTAVVTGASRGIGKAIALELAASGHRVCCVSRSVASSQPVVDAIIAAGGQAKAYAVDVSSADEVKAACEAMLKEWGLVDVLVNNAGITRDGLMIRMSDDDWNQVIQTNLTSCFTWTRELIRPMARARWGRVINIASVIGLIGNAGQANYAAAKAGIIGMTKSVAKEFAARNITANVVAPGFIQTDMTDVLGDEVKEQILKQIPMKRMGTPEDISKVVGFLASSHSDYVTGQVFTVDGGMVM
ncbi:MAG: 3-oxoacyl-[acyl-carrier-protein] reductase [Puniceicoccaceae bacterium]